MTSILWRRIVPHQVIPDLLDYDSIVVESKPSDKPSRKLETCFSSNITSEQQLTALTSYDFWKKYLGKGEMLSNLTLLKGKKIVVLSFFVCYLLSCYNYC
jgi:hypothetical protein